MYVEVSSGLISRCNTLVQAYYLMKTMRRGGEELVIIWPIDAACGIGYHEVFAKDMFSDIKTKIIEVYVICHADKGNRIFRLNNNLLVSGTQESAFLYSFLFILYIMPLSAWHIT